MSEIDKTFESQPAKVLYKSADSNIIEKGVWDLIQPYLWKIAVTVLFFVTTTICYFTVRNSQNTSDIQNLKNQLQGDEQTIAQLNSASNEQKIRIELLQKECDNVNSINKMLVEYLIKKEK